MSSTATEVLRTANVNLRAGLARLSPEPNASIPLSPTDLSGLLVQLLSAGQCWRSFPLRSAPDAEQEKAISEYRSTVEQLSEILPRIHGRLVTEKARMEIARAHLAAASAWAQASQNTL